MDAKIGTNDCSELATRWNEVRRLEQMSCYSMTSERDNTNLQSVSAIAITAVGDDIGGASLIFRSDQFRAKQVDRLRLKTRASIPVSNSIFWSRFPRFI